MSHKKNNGQHKFYCNIGVVYSFIQEQEWKVSFCISYFIPVILKKEPVLNVE